MIPKETNTQKSFREHVEVVIRRRYFFILPLLVVFTVAVALSFVLPPVYQAAAVIQINDKRIIDPLVAGFAVSPGVREQVDAVAKQIVSWPRLALLIKQLRLADDARSVSAFERYVVEFRKRIAITVKDRDTIEITFQDGSPLVAQKVVNTITQNFIDDNSKGKREDARNAIEFIGEQLKIYRGKLESSQSSFASHRIEADLREALNRRKLLQAQMKNAERMAPAQVRMEQNPVVGRLQARLADLQMELSRLMIDATAENPRLIAVKNEIAKVKAALDGEIRKDTVRESISLVNPLYVQTEQELRKVEMEIGELEKRRKELAQRNADSAQPMTDEEVATLETSKRVDEDIYQMLLKQIEAAYVSERLQDSDKGAVFKVIEYARLPYAPIKPEKFKIIFSGLFLGLLTGLGGVFLMEYLDRSFRTSDEAKKHLKIQFLGSVSKIVEEKSGRLSLRTRWNNAVKDFIQKRKLFSEIRFVSPHIVHRAAGGGISPHVVIYHEPKCPVSEEYRIVRTNVQGLGYESTMKTVMLTSSVRGEGKSTTSANLAIALADTGRSTLLIDCDLRRGVVHELLNIAQTPGVTEVIGKGADLESALAQTKVRNLTVLPCGMRPINPSELLGSAKMEKLLNAFKSRFETVIIDAPPVLNLPDASVLGKHADGVVLVVQAERTQREDVLRAHSMLVQAHSNVCGFVLTHVQYYIPKYVYDYLYGT